jgi:ATP-dependent Clp protease ATP-binding subunit ClpA
MYLRLQEDARKLVLTRAAEEAYRRGDRRLSTVHLLLGLLHDAQSVAARTLGVDLQTARDAEIALDRAALAAVGIDTDGLEFPVEAGRAVELPPLSSGARVALRRAMDLARPTKTGRITEKDLLQAILMCQPPDPAAELLAALGVNMKPVLT